jgi:hypothetical protein
MATQKHRNGGKYSGSHTTVIPAAGLIVDSTHKCTAVTKIALGIIKSGLRPSSRGRSVKIKKKDSCLHLSVRDNIAVQQVYVYTNNVESTIQEIIDSAKGKGIEVVVE